MIPSELIHYIHFFSSIDSRRIIEKALCWNTISHKIYIPPKIKNLSFDPIVIFIRSYRNHLIYFISFKEVLHTKTSLNRQLFFDPISRSTLNVIDLYFNELHGLYFNTKNNIFSRDIWIHFCGQFYLSDLLMDP